MRPDIKQTIMAPVGAGGTFSYTGTAGNSPDLPTGISGVFIWCTTACYVKLGPAATATTSDWPVPANTPVFLPNTYEVGNPIRVSAIQIGTGGNAYFQGVA